MTDEVITDSLPPENPDANYDKSDPPMTVGTFYFRGPPKKKLKKATTCNTESSIVVPTPASGMVFPHNEAVANATHKTRKRKSSTKTGVTKKKGPATTTSTSTADTRSTRCGLNLFLLFTTLSFTITSPIHVSYFVYKIRNWIQ